MTTGERDSVGTVVTVGVAFGDVMGVVLADEVGVVLAEEVGEVLEGCLVRE